MFTRNSPGEPQPLAQRLARANNSEQPAPVPESTEKSVIGNDLRIIGQGLKIIGRGVLQVDGEIEGDVQGAEVIVGEKGKVTGMVAARQVIIRETVSGVICGKTVALQASSRVEGDIHRLTIGIEQGALFEGRSRRAGSELELNSVVETASPLINLPSSPGAQPMPLWQYRKIYLNDTGRKTDDIDLLDDAGKNRWELVGIATNNVAYLKRHTAEAVQDTPARAHGRKRESSSASGHRDRVGNNSEQPSLSDGQAREHLTSHEGTR